MPLIYISVLRRGTYKSSRAQKLTALNSNPSDSVTEREKIKKNGGDCAEVGEREFCASGMKSRVEEPEL